MVKRLWKIIKLKRSQRIFISFIMLPAIGLIVLGVAIKSLEYCIGWSFPYMEQYVIACGPVYSAAVAIYISRMNKYKDDEKKELKWKTKTRFFTVLLRKSTAKINTNIKMVELLINHLKEESFQEKVLKLQDINIIIRTFDECNDLLFEALVGRENIAEDNMAAVFTDIVEALTQSIQYNDKIQSTFSTKLVELRDIEEQYLQIIVSLKNIISLNKRKNPSIQQMHGHLKRFTSRELITMNFSAIEEKIILPLADLYDEMTPSATKAEIRQAHMSLKNVVNNYQRRNNNVLESIESDLKMLNLANSVLKNKRVEINRTIDL